MLHRCCIGPERCPDGAVACASRLSPGGQVEQKSKRSYRSSVGLIATCRRSTCNWGSDLSTRFYPSAIDVSSRSAECQFPNLPVPKY
jgi:hypothetical protein